MSNKSNNATFQRPEGSRAIDGPFIMADIEEAIQKLEAEDAWQKNDRNGITLFKTEGTTTVLTSLRAGAVITDNISAGGVLTIQVLDGSVEIAVEEGAEKAGKGDLYFLHRNQPHTIKALEDSRVLVTLTGE